MDNKKKWIATRVQLGWLTLAAGVVVAVLGIVIGQKFAALPYNFRIITGLGILLVGVGLAAIVRYGAALKDERAALRLTVDAKDERTTLIRARAGGRAFWVSTGLVYTGLMWSSFSANGGLPDLAGDTLWYFLAASFIIPFAVYIISMIRDESRL